MEYSPSSRVKVHLLACQIAAPGAWTFYDPDRFESEHRFITIGFSAHQRLVFVAHAEQDEETIRIISARKATAREEEQYAKIR